MGCSSSAAGLEPADKYKPQAEAAFVQRFELGDVLGSGSFAQVLSASDNADGTVCAVKVFKMDAATNLQLQSFQNEVDLWQKVGNNEHCVQLYEVFFGPSSFWLTMEKCTCSVVQKWMTMPNLGEEAISQAAGQMLRGIEHIHNLRIVHRDIKPDNFLYGSDHKVKLCDFGVSAMLPRKGLLKTSAGTAPYMSPEMVGRIGYGLSTDMWSFGVTLYVLMFDDFPYSRRSNSGKSGLAMKEAIRRGTPPKFAKKHKTGKGVSDQTTNFIKTLLNREPSRLLARQALEHPFILLCAEKKPCHQDKASALNTRTGALNVSLPLHAFKGCDADEEASTDCPSHPSSACDQLSLEAACVVVTSDQYPFVIVSADDAWHRTWGFDTNEAIGSPISILNGKGFDRSASQGLYARFLVSSRQTTRCTNAAKDGRCLSHDAVLSKLAGQIRCYSTNFELANLSLTDYDQEQARTGWWHHDNDTD